VVVLVGYLASLALHPRHAHPHVAANLPAAPRLPVAAPPLPVVPAPPPAAAAAPAPAAEKADEEAEPAKEDAPPADDSDSAAKAKSRGAAATAAAPVVDSHRLLDEAERLLHAERFAESQALFEKLAKSKKERRAALLGLAEVAFQEKNYIEAVRSAERAVDRGAGVKAHVLLGDAHFRLGQYKEAAKAYGQALKLDPDNASAKTGLALAQKRM